jgi:DNA-binding transcriptional LysR family regulator
VSRQGPRASHATTAAFFDERTLFSDERTLPVGAARRAGSARRTGSPTLSADHPSTSITRSNPVSTGANFFTPAKLAAFVAVAEEGGVSAAARRLHTSQPALSQIVNALERRLGIKLLERSSTGVRATSPGLTLLHEARAILVYHDQLLQTMATYTPEEGGLIRLGMPLELDPEVIRALARFAADNPPIRVGIQYFSTAAQLAAVRSDELDVGLMHERPVGPEFDSMPVARENLGVLLGTQLTARLIGPHGIRLDRLAGLQWVSLPRSSSPTWYDEVTVVLRSHGLDVVSAGDHQFPTASVAFAAVSVGHSFALAPQHWANPIPEAVVWSPLTGQPVVRRTWAVWRANSRRRDVGRLITAFQEPLTA